jgi:hypothetical protein
LVPELSFLGVDAGIGSQLVEIIETPDVSDLGDEGGGQRPPYAGNRLRRLASSESRTAATY